MGEGKGGEKEKGKEAKGIRCPSTSPLPVIFPHLVNWHVTVCQDMRGIDVTGKTYG